MAQATKAELQVVLGQTRHENDRLRNLIIYLEKEIMFLRKPQINLDTMIVAVERVCDATAHVFKNLEAMERRRGGVL